MRLHRAIMTAPAVALPPPRLGEVSVAPRPHHPNRRMAGAGGARTLPPGDDRGRAPTRSAHRFPPAAQEPGVPQAPGARRAHRRPGLGRRLRLPQARRRAAGRGLHQRAGAARLRPAARVVAAARCSRWPGCSSALAIRYLPGTGGHPPADGLQARRRAAARSSCPACARRARHARLRRGARPRGAAHPHGQRARRARRPARRARRADHAPRGDRRRGQLRGDQLAAGLAAARRVPAARGRPGWAARCSAWCSCPACSRPASAR